MFRLSQLGTTSKSILEDESIDWVTVGTCSLSPLCMFLFSYLLTVHDTLHRRSGGKIHGEKIGQRKKIRDLDSCRSKAPHCLRISFRQCLRNTLEKTRRCCSCNIEPARSSIARGIWIFLVNQSTGANYPHRFQPGLWHLQSNSQKRWDEMYKMGQQIYMPIL